MQRLDVIILAVGEVAVGHIQLCSFDRYIDLLVAAEGCLIDADVFSVGELHGVSVLGRGYVVHESHVVF